MHVDNFFPTIGLYLCEFIYYCTLACARRVVEESGNDSRESEMPCLFVHVPSLVPRRFCLIRESEIDVLLRYSKVSTCRTQ